jgi:hypothetical protein
LDKALTAKILAQGMVRVPFFARGIGNRKNCVRSALLARFFSRTSQRLAGIKGCNLAFWRRDVIAVNGFNEDFVSWGREDSEFVVRLFNAGIWRRNLRFHALGYHLYHPLSTREGLGLNDQLLRVAIEEKLARCARGIDQHLG